MKTEKIRKAPVILPLIFLLTFSFTYSISKAQGNKGTKFSKDDATNFILSSKDHSLKTASENSKKNLSLIAEDKGEKSPVVAGILSAIVPGAGEVYSKSYIKAAIFVAIEAGMWIGYSAYRKKGNDQTDFFQGEADQHWSINRYAQWLHDLNLPESGNINPSEQNFEVLRAQINALESVHFSHTLPPHGVQQYYELIGKYHSFVAGWDDATGTYDQNTYINWSSPRFESYAIDRQQANTYYDKSETFIYGVIINHLLSAADAVWSVSMFNKNLRFNSKFQMTNHFSPVTSKWEFVPTTQLVVTF